MSELAAFSIRQDGAISACDTTRDGLVKIIDAFNAAVTPKRKWWKLR